MRDQSARAGQLSPVSRWQSLCADLPALSSVTDAHRDWFKKKKEKEKEAGSRTTDGPPVRLCALLPLLAASRDEERCLGAKVSLSADVDAADPGARLRR